MTITEITVPGIHCGHCKMSLEGALRALPGVVQAEVSVEDRTIDVTYDEGVTGHNDILAAIEDQGYEVR